MGVTAERIARKSIHTANGIVNITVLIVILLFIAFSGYALWDSNQLYRGADSAQYEIYKPSAENETESFEELQAINGEVFSWLTVYGTHIDYPVTQGEDNAKYVNTNAYGEYSLAGSIFLDYRNGADFQDFNSILYGHHMEKQAMFGEIGSFGDKDYFDRHQYGNLFFAGKNHGLVFFAFVKTDAYNIDMFTPNIKTPETRQEYLKNILDVALYTRDVSVTADDHILLLTTCAPDATNGRDILVAKITDDCYRDMFQRRGTDNASGTQLSKDQQWQRIPLWLKISVPIALLLLLLVIILNHKKQRNLPKE
ncbi:MAG TPA: class B sortase [Clostridiales bacterium]|nr:class B sortase [Clostridiales bacterium]